MVNGKYRMPGSKSSHLLFTVYALDLVVILRTNGTKNLVLVFDLSTPDSRNLKQILRFAQNDKQKQEREKLDVRRETEGQNTGPDSRR